MHFVPVPAPLYTSVAPPNANNTRTRLISLENSPELLLSPPSRLFFKGGKNAEMQYLVAAAVGCIPNLHAAGTEPHRDPSYYSVRSAASQPTTILPIPAARLSSIFLRSDLNPIARVRDAALPEGEAHTPFGGYLYFLYSRKLKNIKQLELLYSGGLGNAVIVLR